MVELDIIEFKDPEGRLLADIVFDPTKQEYCWRVEGLEGKDVTGSAPHPLNAVTSVLHRMGKLK